MERYEANGSRPRAKLSDSFSDFETEKKIDAEEGTNSTLVPQHPTMSRTVRCWDAGTVLGPSF
jgi:hypothetical protein